ncbi:MAG: phage terminase large subunit family protein [Desulfopila sp.]
MFRRQKIQKPSVWAPKNRKIIKGDLAGSYLNLDITPHLRGIMDAAVLPYVREVIICAAPQTAKTTGVDTIVAWSRVFAKGPACSFYPDETTAKRSMKDRIAPMVKQSPALSRQVSRGRDSYTTTGIEMTGGEWEVGWVGSVAQTADRSLKYVDMQEVNKPSYGVSKDETSPVALLRKRVRSYGDTGKIFMSSSPTTVEGNITQLLEHECEAVFIQWVTCPYCHNEIHMFFNKKNFWWPTGDDGKSIDRKTIKSKSLARYVCQECGERWDDNDRNKATPPTAWLIIWESSTGSSRRRRAI